MPLVPDPWITPSRPSADAASAPTSEASTPRSKHAWRTRRTTATPSPQLIRLGVKLPGRPRIPHTLAVRMRCRVPHSCHRRLHPLRALPLHRPPAPPISRGCLRTHNYTKITCASSRKTSNRRHCRHEALGQKLSANAIARSGTPPIRIATRKTRWAAPALSGWLSSYSWAAYMLA